MSLIFAFANECLDNLDHGLYKRLDITSNPLSNFKLENNKSHKKTDRLWIESSLDILKIDTNTYIHNSIPIDLDKRIYKKERKELHQKIKNKFIENCLPVSFEKKPYAVLFMGLPGAGKSTIIAHYKLKIEKKSNCQPAVLGVDNIVEEIPEFQQALNIKLDDGKIYSAKDAWHNARIEARHVIEELREDVITNRMNIIYDSTGVSEVHENIINGTDGLKARGYKVKVIYVDVSVETAFNRTEIRAIHTGRAVLKRTLEDNTDTNTLLKKKFMQYTKNANIDSLKIINNEFNPIIVYEQKNIPKSLPSPHNSCLTGNGFV